MKRPLDYTPKYSLSIVYLKKILTKEELRDLLRRYVEAKVSTWTKDIKGKK